MTFLIDAEIKTHSYTTLELNEINSPKTVHQFIEKLPFYLTLNV